MDAHFHLMMYNPMANTITAKCGTGSVSTQYVCMCTYSILEVLKCNQVAYAFIHTDVCMHTQPLPDQTLGERGGMNAAVLKERLAQFK